MKRLSRSQRAMQIAMRAGDWQPARHGVLIPSQRNPDVRYLVNEQRCSCPDQSRHPKLVCKHRLATRIFMGRQR